MNTGYAPCGLAPITMTGHYTSRHGVPATVLCTDKPKGSPVVAWLADGSVICCDAYGRMNPKMGPNPYDLIEVRP